METCGMSCIKYLLFVFNFIFALSGIAIIAAGAYVLKDVDDFSNFVENSTLAPPIILTVAGIIVFLIAFLGCCGAIKENYNMLIAFSVLLLLIFIIEIAVGVAAAVNRDSFKDHLRKAMKASKDNYDVTTAEDRKVWAQLQSKLECCGVDGPSDWVMGGLYPESCCKTSEPSSSPDRLCGPSKEFVHQEGCFSKLSTRIREGSIIVMGVGIGIALIELAGIVLACLLASAIKKESEEEEKE
ncbi:hypothetical protein RUM43_006032 [Polyplax serrata]|uniref:Tetraspanin n=1 Tax=Polyplax serrata TaxID=468196 RepID=A0AAN8S1W0_POLSC